MKQLKCLQNVHKLCERSARPRHYSRKVLYCNSLQYFCWVSTLDLVKSCSSSLGNPAPLQELSIIIDQTKATPAVLHLTNPPFVCCTSSQSSLSPFLLTYGSSRKLHPPKIANITLYQHTLNQLFASNATPQDATFIQIITNK